VQWLEGNLKHYANQKLGMTFDIEPIRVTTDEYKKYKRGLEVLLSYPSAVSSPSAGLIGR